eukprot:jgi/Chrpa1/12933/Chrysochromulina_OHIO_Genome00022119-RA
MREGVSRVLMAGDVVEALARGQQSAHPNCSSSWRTFTVGGHNLTDCEAYRQGLTPTHYTCNTTDRTRIHDVILAECRSACSADAACSVMHWQGLKANNFSEDAIGQCFLLHQACFTASKYDTELAPSFCMQTEMCSRAPEPANAPVYTAISVAFSLGGSVRRAVGSVRKYERNPILIQDRPWETRLDNGYPNVVPPSGGDPDQDGPTSWQLWYGDCISAPTPGAPGCEKQVLLYANSTDGLAWHKPTLGLYDIGPPHHKENNVVLYGGGLGVTYDAHDPDSSQHRYVGLGRACWASGTCPLDAVRTSSVGVASDSDADLAVSADGLIWHGVATLAWPSPQRYDCHNQVFWDEPLQRYVAVTRDGFSGPVGRTIGITTSPTGALGFDTTAAPLEALYGDEQRQLYSQITFRWHNTFLGIVMVYEAQSGEGRVRCRLAWSNAPESTEWRWVDDEGEAGGLAGAEFVPLGAAGSFDSHICFAAARPIPHAAEERIYYMGGNGPHSGARNSSLGLATLRRDGYASLMGSGRVVTVPLTCTGPQLKVSVDMLPGAAAASFRVGLAAVPASDPLSLAHALPVTMNVTDAAIRFHSGASFEKHVGATVALELELAEAAVYTFGWG